MSLAIARRLDLRLQARILTRKGALRLGFTDESTLWLSGFGAQLATAASGGSIAHRFAQALARALGWVLLTDRKGWLVPEPRDPGDWLAAPAPRLRSLQGQILRNARIERLTGSTLSPERVLRSLGNEALQIGPKRAETAPRPRFLLLSKACLASSPEAFAAGIDQMMALSAEDPDLQALWFDPGSAGVKRIPVTEVVNILLSGLAATDDALPSRTPQRAGGLNDLGEALDDNSPAPEP